MWDDSAFTWASVAVLILVVGTTYYLAKHPDPAVESAADTELPAADAAEAPTKRAGGLNPAPARAGRSRRR
jgi:hypothetical protein